MARLLAMLGVFLVGAVLADGAGPASSTLIGRFDISQANIQYHNPRSGVSLNTEQTRALVLKLYASEALNQREIVDELGLLGDLKRGEGFVLANPYYPRYQGANIPLPKPRSVQRDGAEVLNPEGYADSREGYHLVDGRVEYFQRPVVTQWFSDLSHGKAVAEQVCAVQFVDAGQSRYRLKTFASASAALQAGWTITHQYHCGSCSTLKDLAAYIGIPDQTTPIRACTKQGQGRISQLDEVKQCIVEAVGFTELCAEAWAYNGIHTAAQCIGDCLRAYGGDALLSPLLRGIYNMMVRGEFSACPAEVESADPELRASLQARGCPLANENSGKLNACLWCDEKTSGPGFKYAAARTRRGSGLPSAIPRPNDRLFYEADHSAYFKIAR